MALSPDRLQIKRPTLVIAASARVLTESGRKGNLPVLAIDQYADEDTQRASHALERVTSLDGGFSSDRLQKTIERLDPDGQSEVILGGGLDSHPEQIQAIARERTLLGNSPRLFMQLKDPESCFKLLDDLAIPYPEISWTYPADPSSWLLKTGCSEGGKGVRFPAHDQAASGEYYQRRLAGSTYSVLFLANGNDLRIIGFNTLQTIAVGKTPFLFAGAMNFTDLGRNIQRVVAGFALKLVRKTGLVGLNSMDFMIDPLKGPLVLEINPRPSATMALYDRDAPFGLLQAHIQAIGGSLMPVPITTQARAFHVVLARRSLVIPESLVWPSWCHDRPAKGTSVRTNTPFCTVEAEASSPQRVLRRLGLRVSLLKSLMDTPQQPPSFSYPV